MLICPSIFILILMIFFLELTMTYCYARCYRETKLFGAEMIPLVLKCNFILRILTSYERTVHVWTML